MGENRSRSHRRYLVGPVYRAAEQGARLDIQMTRVNDEVWLPKHIEAKASARLALVKKYRIESDTTFSNYRKVSSGIARGGRYAPALKTGGASTVR